MWFDGVMLLQPTKSFVLSRWLAGDDRFLSEPCDALAVAAALQACRSSTDVLCRIMPSVPNRGIWAQSSSRMDGSISPRQTACRTARLTGDRCSL